MPTLSRSIQDLLLSLAGEAHLDRLLEAATRGLAAEDDVALARVWLIRPGDRCARCPMQEPCPDERHTGSSANRVEPK